MAWHESPTPTSFSITLIKESKTIKKGSTIIDGEIAYKVTSLSGKTGTVQVTNKVLGSKNNSAKSLIIPSIIKKDGKKFKVTSIKAKAFRNNCYHLKKIIIGANVESIGKEAFYDFGDHDIPITIIFKTTKLQASKVGKDAFWNDRGAVYWATDAITNVKIPYAVYDKYVNFLKKKGLKSGVTFIPV